MMSITIDTSKNTAAVPSEFICPITMEIMIHPVMTRYGHCFDRSAIMTWMSSSDGDQCECPLTRKPLRISDIINNHALGQRIKAWCDENSYQCKQNETPNDSTSDDDDEDDFVTHFFVSADLKEIKDRKNRLDRNSLLRSQNLRNPTAATPTTHRARRNLIRLAVSWTQRT